MEARSSALGRRWTGIRRRTQLDSPVVASFGLRLVESYQAFTPGLDDLGWRIANFGHHSGPTGATPSGFIRHEPAGASTARLRRQRSLFRRARSMHPPGSREAGLLISGRPLSFRAPPVGSGVPLTGSESAGDSNGGRWRSNAVGLTPELLENPSRMVVSVFGDFWGCDQTLTLRLRGPGFAATLGMTRTFPACLHICVRDGRLFPYLARVSTISAC